MGLFNNRIQPPARRDGQPVAVTPRVDQEIETAHNIPGRGVVDHGVSRSEPAQWNAEDVAYDPTRDLVHFEPESPETAAIPVYVVGGPGEGKVVHSFRTMYAAVGPNPVRIAGEHGNRTKLRVNNRGARTLFVGDTPSVSSMFGFPVPAGGQLELSSSRAVYGVIDAYTPNSAPATATNPADTTGWAGANGTVARVAAPWNPNRGAIQLTATAAGYSAQTPTLVVSGRAGQTVYYRVKLAWNTGATPAMYVRPWDSSGAVTNLTTVAAAAITNTAGWVEITGSFVLPRDVSNLFLRIGSSAGAAADQYTVGDVSTSIDVDPGVFMDAGVAYDNQPVALYEEFDVQA